MSSAWELLLGSVGAGSAAIGLIFVAIQLRLALRQARQAQHEQRLERLRLKRQATIDFAVNTFDARSALRANLPEDVDDQAVKALVQRVLAGQDAKSREAVLKYLSYVEIFALAVSSGAYDLETADALFGYRLLRIRENYWPFVQDRRATVEQQEAYLREFEWLCDEVIRFRRTTRGYDLRDRYIPLALRARE